MSHQGMRQGTRQERPTLQHKRLEACLENNEQGNKSEMPPEGPEARLQGKDTRDGHTQSWLWHERYYVELQVVAAQSAMEAQESEAGTGRLRGGYERRQYIVGNGNNATRKRRWQHTISKGSGKV